MRFRDFLDDLGAYMGGVALALMPVCAALTLTACGPGGGERSDARSTSETTNAPANDPAPATLRVYKVVKQLDGENGCEANKATPMREPITPFMVVNPKGGTVELSQVTACMDSADCLRVGRQVENGESSSSIYTMFLDNPGAESSTGTIIASGNHQSGKCLGAHETRMLVTESGDKGRIEARNFVYEDHEAKLEDCSAAFAKKKNVPSTCRSIQIFELERVDKQ